KNAARFKELGIYEIYVLTENYSFVINKCIQVQGIQNIKPIPDGNGQFTEALDMLVDKTNIVFGKRSWRYAMIEHNG
ncbi:peroxiredoxin, partial [Francisella tularensis subsp. holarctica]|nr:peroxiredoxin [Francisella tularensis subsp. holarctica]